MREREPRLTGAVVRWGKHFNDQALIAARKFYLDFNIEQSLQLSPVQRRVFAAYFAHYWVMKKNADSGRMARNPIYEQMLKIPLINIVAEGVYNINDGVNIAGKMLLEMAQKYANVLGDDSHFDLRNAANILSSIFLEQNGPDELNQKIDGALSRVKIGKTAAKP